MTTAAPPLMLPNPETPLAWLPPDIAGQLQASDYVFVGTLGVCVLEPPAGELQAYNIIGLDMGSPDEPRGRVFRTSQALPFSPEHRLHHCSVCGVVIMKKHDRHVETDCSRCYISSQQPFSKVR